MYAGFNAQNIFESVSKMSRLPVDLRQTSSSAKVRVRLCTDPALLWRGANNEQSAPNSISSPLTTAEKIEQKIMEENEAVDSDILSHSDNDDDTDDVTPRKRAEELQIRDSNSDCISPSGAETAEDIASIIADNSLASEVATANLSASSQRPSSAPPAKNAAPKRRPKSAHPSKRSQQLKDTAASNKKPLGRSMRASQLQRTRDMFDQLRNEASREVQRAHLRKMARDLLLRAVKDDDADAEVEQVRKVLDQTFPSLWRQRSSAPASLDRSREGSVQSRDGSLVSGRSHFSSLLDYDESKQTDVAKPQGWDHPRPSSKSSDRSNKSQERNTKGREKDKERSSKRESNRATELKNTKNKRESQESQKPKRPVRPDDTIRRRRPDDVIYAAGNQVLPSEKLMRQILNAEQQNRLIHDIKQRLREKTRQRRQFAD